MWVFRPAAFKMKEIEIIHRLKKQEEISAQHILNEFEH